VRACDWLHARAARRRRVAHLLFAVAPIRSRRSRSTRRRALVSTRARPDLGSPRTLAPVRSPRRSTRAPSLRRRLATRPRLEGSSGTRPLGTSHRASHERAALALGGA
jgi:hypothetical protein